MIAYADLRWPAQTGIGAVQSALLARLPAGIEIVDLHAASRIGSPMSPLSVTRALSRSGARKGVFWSPGFVPPLRSAIPAVVTVHDLTHLRFYTKLHAAYYDIVLKFLYRRCRAVICVSDYTRNEFLNWSGMPADRVFTVHNGVSRELFAGDGNFGLAFPYVFYPGNRRKYKNLDRLLRAYASSAVPREGIHLVLTGNPDDHLARLAAEAGVGELLHFTGKVADSDLARLYRGATLTAFVSLYEGFGLPIVESMAAGVPVLTSNLAAMPEVAGNAALLVDPTATEAIAAALERLVFDGGLRERLIGAGRIQAARFDWDLSAAQAWKIVVGAAA